MSHVKVSKSENTDSNSDPMKHKGISKRICELCDEKGVSFYQVAFDAALPVNTVMNAVRGGNPTFNTINAICCGLGVSVRDFFNSEDFDSIAFPDDEDR